MPLTISFRFVSIPQLGCRRVEKPRKMASWSSGSGKPLVFPRRGLSEQEVMLDRLHEITDPVLPQTILDYFLTHEGQTDPNQKLKRVTIRSGTIVNWFDYENSAMRNTVIKEDVQVCFIADDNDKKGSFYYDRKLPLPAWHTLVDTAATKSIKKLR
jgi:hypothetical protein